MAYDPDPQLGATPFRRVCLGVTEDKNVVLAAPGRLLSLNVSNIATAPCYVKFYNQTTSPAVASDVPVWSCSCVGLAAGGTAFVPLPPEGINFSVGIAYVVVTGLADTNATEVANTDVIVSGSYKASS